VAQSLEYSHVQGVLHRDVKPANILVDGEDNVWVTDFGLAKLIDANDATASGNVVGTLRYIAPESFQTNLTQALAALDAIFDQVAERDLPQSIRQADEDGDATSIGAGLTADDAELLQSLLRFYEEFARTNQSSATLNVELAGAHKKVGDILARLGQYDQAGSAFRTALRVYESLMAKTPDCVAYVLATAEVHNAIGRVVATGGELGRAKDAHFAAVALLESLPPEEADSARVRFALAQSWSLLVAVRAQELVASRRNSAKNVARVKGTGASRRERPKRASRKPDSSPSAPRKRRDLAHQPPWLEEGFEQALALLGQLVVEEPDNPDYRLALGRCYRSMLPAAWHEKDQTQATEMKQQAIDILDDLVVEHPDRAIYAYELADTLAMTAPVAALTSLPPDDVDHLDRAVQLARQLMRRYPTSHLYKALAGSLAKLAAHHSATDAFENAASQFEDCILLLRMLREEAPGNQVYLLTLARASRDYGELLRGKESLDRSRSVLEEAITEYEAYRKTPGTRKPSTRLLVMLYHSLSATQTQLGQDQLATEARRKADLLREAASGKR